MTDTPATCKAGLQVEQSDERALARRVFAESCARHGFLSQAKMIEDGREEPGDGAAACLDAMLAFASVTPKPVSPAADQRARLAGMIALAGLGTNTGEPRLPHGDWKPDEFEARILEIIPSRASEQCFALADAILAREVAPPPVSGEVEAMREACAKLAETRHEHWAMSHPDDAGHGEVCCDVTACRDIAAAIRALPLTPYPKEPQA